MIFRVVTEKFAELLQEAQLFKMTGKGPRKETIFLCSIIISLER